MNLINGGSQLYSNLSGTSLYDLIKTNKFEEQIGTYYMEDLISEKDNTSDTGNSNSDSNYTQSHVNDVNKTRRRLIRYVLRND